MLDLVGTEPLRRPTIGSAPIRVLLDPEPESREVIKLASQPLQVRAELTERYVIPVCAAKTLQEWDIQGRGVAGWRRHDRLPIRFKNEHLLNL